MLVCACVGVTRSATRRGVGSVGSLPAAIRQNRFLGMPIVLFAEQVTLCLRQGWVRLLDGSALRAPTAAEAAHFEEQRRAERGAQLAAWDADRRRRAGLHTESPPDGPPPAPAGTDGAPAPAAAAARLCRSARRRGGSGADGGPRDGGGGGRGPARDRRRSGRSPPLPASASVRLLRRPPPPLGDFITPASRFGGDFLCDPCTSGLDRRPREHLD